MGFASCSNDEIVKVWSMEGKCLKTFIGHTGFVFACASPVLPAFPVFWSSKHVFDRPFGARIVKGEGYLCWCT